MSFSVFPVLLSFLWTSLPSSSSSIHTSDPHPPLCPLDNLQFYENSFYSQNGEDGVLLKLLSTLGITNKYFVEFGVENGEECNTRFLRESYNFSGLMMDGSHENQGIGLFKEFITIHNILELFDKYAVPQDFDLLSIDLDLYDWWILAKILGATKISTTGQQERAFRPRIIVVEVNPSLGITTPSLRYQFHHRNQYPLTVTHPITSNQTTWDLTRYSGANPKAFQLLGQQFGYEMVYCESCGVNCFLIRRDLIPSSCLRNSRDHLPLPHLSYPCYATMSNNYQRGHPIDPNPHRTPLFVDSRLLTLAATDSLSSLPPLFAFSQLQQNLFHSTNKRFSSILSPLASPSSTYLLNFSSKVFSEGDLETSNLMPDLSPQQLESFLRLVDEAYKSYSLQQQKHLFDQNLPNSFASSPFLTVSFCEVLQQSSLHEFPHSLLLPNGESANFPPTTCEEISSRYAQLIFYHLTEATLHSQGSQPDFYLSIRQRTQQLLSEGLSYFSQNEILLTIQRYVSLSNHLTCPSPSAPSAIPRVGCGEHRFAQVPISVTSSSSHEEEERWISVGIGICDSISQQSLRLAEVFEMSESHRNLLEEYFIEAIQQQIFGSSFRDCLISGEWLRSDHSTSSVLANIPTILRVLFPPLSSFSSLSTSLYSSGIISGSEICKRRARQAVLLIFDDSSSFLSSSTEGNDVLISATQSINNQIISACGCNVYLIRTLLGAPLLDPPQGIGSEQENFPRCLRNLLELSNGFLPHGVRNSSSHHQIFQEMYESTFHSLSSPTSIYISSLFTFTSPLWSGPLGGIPKSLKIPSSREINIFIPLPHPLAATCQILQRYESSSPALSPLLSISEILQFYQNHFRSLIKSLWHHAVSGNIFLYLPDLEEDYTSKEGRMKLQQVYGSLREFLLDPTSSFSSLANNESRIPSDLRNFEAMKSIQYFQCDVSLNPSSSSSASPAIGVPQWIMDCYGLLDTYPHKLLLLDENTVEALNQCLPPPPPL